MTEYNLYRVTYLNFCWSNSVTHIHSDSFARAVEEVKDLAKQEKWKDIKAIDEIGKIYL